MAVTRKVYDGAAWQWPMRLARAAGAWGPTISGLVWDGSGWVSTLGVADTIPVLEGAAATSAATATANALTVAMPVGITAGEMLISFLAVKGTTQVISGIPAGWQAVTPSTTSAYQISTVMSKIADGTETNWSVTWTGAAARAIGWVARFSGCHRIESSGVNFAKATTVNATTVGSISTAGVNRRLLLLSSVGRSDAFTWTLPDGMSQISSWFGGSASSGGQTGLVADQAVGSGATGTRAFSWASGGAASVHAWLIALAPPFVA